MYPQPGYASPWGYISLGIAGYTHHSTSRAVVPNLFISVTPDTKNREDSTPCAYKKMLKCKDATRVHLSLVVQFSLLAEISFYIENKARDSFSFKCEYSAFRCLHILLNSHTGFIGCSDTFAILPG